MYTFGVIETLANGVSLINELGIENVDAHIHEMEELLRSLIADLSLKVVEPPRKSRLRKRTKSLKNWRSGSSQAARFWWPHTSTRSTCTPT